MKKEHTLVLIELEKELKRKEHEVAKVKEDNKDQKEQIQNLESEIEAQESKNGKY